MSNSSILSIGRTLFSATTLGQSGSGSNGNEGVLHIPQSSRITEAATTDCLISYPGHLLEEGSYASAEMQSVYSTAPANWADYTLSWTLSVEIRMHQLHPKQNDETPPAKNKDIARNCFQWWGSTSGALGRVKSLIHCRYSQVHSNLE